MQIGSLIRRAALHYKDAPCLTEGDRTLSFREFDEATDRLGNALIAKGLQPGDRVGAQCYGRAENPMAITYLRPEHRDRIGSCGRPYSVVEVAIVDDDDKPVPVAERGEIVCHGPQTRAYHWGMAEVTAEAFRNGWLHTGDIGVMDAADFFYIVDRKSDMLIFGGYNVYPREVEDGLMGFPWVLEAPVVGLPNEKWGNRVVAVVAGQPGLDVGGARSRRPRKSLRREASKANSRLARTTQERRNKILCRSVRDTLVAQAAEVGA